MGHLVLKMISSTVVLSMIYHWLACGCLKIFLITSEQGVHRGKPISVRGVQKRFEYYAKKSGVPISCHQLLHTMATQLLNADTALVSIQDLLSHTRIKTKQRSFRLSNNKGQCDYYKAMERILEQTKNKP